MKKACPSLVLIPALKRECSSGPASISDPDLELGVINSSRPKRESRANNRHTAKIIKVINALPHMAIKIKPSFCLST